MASPIILKHRQEFIEILANYSPSEAAKARLKTLNYVPLSGLAGGGRNTVINFLTEHYNYRFAVSDTTRPPKLRGGKMEVNGVHYYFRSEEDMLKDLRNGEFLEAELIHNQQVSGTSMRELERVSADGKIPIHDVEFGGAENIHKANPDNIIIGLLPPSYDEWIRRFKEREEISDEEYGNRLRTAEQVLKHMIERPYFKLVVNDSVERCAADIRKIVEESVYSADNHRFCQSLAKDILQKVEQALAQLAL